MAAGAAVAVALLTLLVRVAVDLGAGETTPSREFSALTSYDIWVLMLAGTVALWVAIAVVAARAVRQVYPRAGPEITVALIGYVLLAAFTIALLLQVDTGLANPLYAASVKITGAMIAMLACAAPIAVGLWLGQARIVALRKSLVGSGRPQTDAERRTSVRLLLGIYGFMNASLGFVSVGISAVVLTTGALRNAVLAAGAATESEFPSSHLLLYGGFFTLVFAIVFVPAFVEWRGVARRLVDDAYDVPLAAKPGESFFEERGRMEQLLHLDTTVGKVLTSSLGILAPLATSALAVFVPQLASAAGGG